MESRGYRFVRQTDRDTQLKRAYVLLASSFLYFMALVLDASYLIPEWKYHRDPFIPSHQPQLSRKIQMSSGKNKETSRWDAKDCAKLLPAEYMQKHQVIETKGSPKPHSTVFALPISESIITRHLVKDGVWHLDIYKRIKKYIHEGMTFLDVGSNIGLFSVYAQSLGANVISVEAMESNAKFTQASECLNYLRTRNSTSTLVSGSISLYNYIIHPVPHSVDCDVASQSNNRDDGHVLCMSKQVKVENKQARVQKDEEQMHLATLDNIVRDAMRDLHKDGMKDIIELMKIDVEGFEQAVMESARGIPPPQAIIFECDAKQAKSKNHNTLFWRRYLKENSSRCHGFVYSTGGDRITVALKFPYLPFVDAIALGTCGGGDFYLDCSIKGEGIVTTLYRWSVHFFFGLSFFLGLRILLHVRSRTMGGDEAGNFQEPFGEMEISILFSVLRQKRFMLGLVSIALLTIVCHYYFIS